MALNTQQLIGQIVYLNDKETKQAIIGKITQINNNKLKIKWLWILANNGKTDCSKNNLEYDYYIYDLDKDIQRITFNKLVAGDHMGSAAHDIYKKCVYAVGFSERKVSLFLPHTNLYSEGATKEGYDVWFLCNSNIFISGGSTRWKNDVNEDLTEIKETWIKPGDDMSDSGNLRVTFLKNQFGNYEFMGVFKLVDVDSKLRVKTYRRISKEYPII